MRAILFVLLKYFLVMTKGYSLTFDVLLKLDKEAQEFLVDSLANYRQQQSESSIEPAESIVPSRIKPKSSVNKDHERRKRKSYHWDKIKPKVTYQQNQASPSQNILTRVASDKKFVNLGQGFLYFHDGESQLTRPFIFPNEPGSQLTTTLSTNPEVSNYEDTTSTLFTVVRMTATAKPEAETKIDKSKSFVNLGQQQFIVGDGSNLEADVREVHRSEAQTTPSTKVDSSKKFVNFGGEQKYFSYDKKVKDTQVPKTKALSKVDHKKSFVNLGKEHSYVADFDYNFKFNDMVLSSTAMSTAISTKSTSNATQSTKRPTTSTTLITDKTTTAISTTVSTTTTTKTTTKETSTTIPVTTKTTTFRTLSTTTNFISSSSTVTTTTTTTTTTTDTTSTTSSTTVATATTTTSSSTTSIPKVPSRTTTTALPQVPTIIPSETTTPWKETSTFNDSDFVFPTRIKVPAPTTTTSTTTSTTTVTSQTITTTTTSLPPVPTTRPSETTIQSVIIFPQKETSTLSDADFLFPTRIEVPETNNNFEKFNLSKSVDDDAEDEIRSSADLIFAIDSFSNLIDYNPNINLEADVDEESNDNDVCYTHTILLIGRCVVMCREQIVEFCG